MPFSGTRLMPSAHLKSLDILSCTARWSLTVEFAKSAMKTPPSPTSPPVSPVSERCPSPSDSVWDCDGREEDSDVEEQIEEDAGDRSDAEDEHEEERSDNGGDSDEGDTSQRETNIQTAQQIDLVNTDDEEDEKEAEDEMDETQEDEYEAQEEEYEVQEDEGEAPEEEGEADAEANPSDEQHMTSVASESVNGVGQGLDYAALAKLALHLSEHGSSHYSKDGRYAELATMFNKKFNLKDDDEISSDTAQQYIGYLWSGALTRKLPDAVQKLVNKLKLIEHEKRTEDGKVICRLPLLKPQLYPEISAIIFSKLKGVDGFAQRDTEKWTRRCLAAATAVKWSVQQVEFHVDWLVHVSKHETRKRSTTLAENAGLCATVEKYAMTIPRDRRTPRSLATSTIKSGKAKRVRVADDEPSPSTSDEGERAGRGRHRKKARATTATTAAVSTIRGAAAKRVRVADDEPSPSTSDEGERAGRGRHRKKARATTATTAAVSTIRGAAARSSSTRFFKTPTARRASPLPAARPKSKPVVERSGAGSPTKINTRSASSDAEEFDFESECEAGDEILPEVANPTATKRKYVPPTETQRPRDAKRLRQTYSPPWLTSKVPVPASSGESVSRQCDFERVSSYLLSELFNPRMQILKADEEIEADVREQLDAVLMNAGLILEASAPQASIAHDVTPVQDAAIQREWGSSIREVIEQLPSQADVPKLLKRGDAKATWKKNYTELPTSIQKIRALPTSAKKIRALVEQAPVCIQVGEDIKAAKEEGVRQLMRLDTRSAIATSNCEQQLADAVEVLNKCEAKAKRAKEAFDQLHQLVTGEKAKLKTGEPDDDKLVDVRFYTSREHRQLAADFKESADKRVSCRKEVASASTWVEFCQALAGLQSKVSALAKAWRKATNTKLHKRKEEKMKEVVMQLTDVELSMESERLKFATHTQGILLELEGDLKKYEGKLDTDKRKHKNQREPLTQKYLAHIEDSKGAIKLHNEDLAKVESMVEQAKGALYEYTREMLDELTAGSHEVCADVAPAQVERPGSCNSQADPISVDEEAADSEDDQVCSADEDPMPMDEDAADSKADQACAADADDAEETVGQVEDCEPSCIVS